MESRGKLRTGLGHHRWRNGAWRVCAWSPGRLFLELGSCSDPIQPDKQKPCQVACGFSSWSMNSTGTLTMRPRHFGFISARPPSFGITEKTRLSVQTKMEPPALRMRWHFLQTPCLINPSLDGRPNRPPHPTQLLPPGFGPNVPLRYPWTSDGSMAPSLARFLSDGPFTY